MGAALFKMFYAKTGKESLKSSATSLWDFSAMDIDGVEVNLKELCAGKKAILVVNVASK